MVLSFTMFGLWGGWMGPFVSAGDFRTGLLGRLGILLLRGSVQNASKSMFFLRVCSAGVSAVIALVFSFADLPCV